MSSVGKGPLGTCGLDQRREGGSRLFFGFLVDWRFEAGWRPAAVINDRFWLLLLRCWLRWYEDGRRLTGVNIERFWLMLI